MERGGGESLREDGDKLGVYFFDLLFSLFAKFLLLTFQEPNTRLLKFSL